MEKDFYCRHCKKKFYHPKISFQNVHLDSPITVIEQVKIGVCPWCGSRDYTINYFEEIEKEKEQLRNEILEKKLTNDQLKQAISKLLELELISPTKKAD